MSNEYIHKGLTETLIKSVVLAFLCLTSLQDGLSQGKFHYRQPINSPETEGWYSISLPPEVFSRANRDLSDFRILTIGPKDTVEIPYLLRVLNDVVTEELAPVDIFNESRKGGVYYITLQLKKNQTVNRLYLDFDQDNFNGKLNLEGSPDAKDWFSIGDPQRILSVHRESIDFKATTLSFPSTRYAYIRLTIRSDTALSVANAALKRREIKPGIQVPASLVNLSSVTEKTTKQTEITATFKTIQPIASVRLYVASSEDYYRPVTIEALRDSAKVPKGWTYYYDQLYSGYISSLDSNRFEFPYALTNKLRITIQNEDNQPLVVNSITATGPRIELVAKMKTGTYAMYYGDSKLGFPSYDVIHFTEKIPENVPELGLGPPEILIQPEAKGSPLFSNKLWLWGIMALVIGLLGYFTLRMMKQKT